MTETLAHKAVKGVIWAIIDRFGSIGIQFIVNLILARLLLPADFGIIGMLGIFLAVSQCLIDSGFGSALIQKKNPTQTDYSTIFYWNLIFSVILYIILYILAPLIAEFYSIPQLTDILRVLAFSLIITGVFSIQKTRLQKSLAFKTLALVNLSSYALGAILAISLAYNNCGVWSLVSMQLSYGIICVILVCMITHWIPNVGFSKASIRELFGFGGYIMAANILQTICQNLQGIIIGKRFSATQMGYFSQAYKLDQITSYSIPQVIVQVMYPVYSSIQDDKERLNNMVLMNMRVIAFLVFPLLSLLIIIADPLITFLYGEKWLPSVPYFRILCIGGFFISLQNINFYAVASVGRSKSLFIWSFYKWGFLLTALLVGMNFGMYGIMWGMVMSSANIFLTNVYLAQKHINLRMIRQIGNIFPIIIIVMISIFIGFSINYVSGKTLLSGGIAVMVYMILSLLLHLNAIQDTKLILKRLLFHRKNTYK